MKEAIIGGAISIILWVIGYFIGNRKRYNKTLYCYEINDFRTVTTGTFSKKMTVQYDGTTIKENMWCIQRAFVNLEKTDIMCGEDKISIKAPNGIWMDAELDGLSENLSADNIKLEISGNDPSILELSFKNLRINEGFSIQGLMATYDSRMGILDIKHRIPDLNDIRIVSDKEIPLRITMIRYWYTLLFWLVVYLIFIWVKLVHGNHFWDFFNIFFLAGFFIFSITLLVYSLRISRKRRVQKIACDLKRS